MIVDATPERSLAVRTGPSRWEIALFAAALATVGIVALTLFFAGDATYSEIALAPGRPPATFRIMDTAPGTISGGRMTMSPDELLALHRGWVGYVSGRAERQPPGLEAAEYFTARERAHMADVRNVFVAAQVAALLAALVLIWLAVRAWRRGSLAGLVRAGTVAALVLVAAVAAVAALAFDAAFLLFHQVFFPQGNFLFEPGSNLLELYPQEYFYGVTLRIGASFVGAALLLAAAAHASLRRGRTSA